MGRKDNKRARGGRAGARRPNNLGCDPPILSSRRRTMHTPTFPSDLDRCVNGNEMRQGYLELLFMRGDGGGEGTVVAEHDGVSRMSQT